MTQTNIRPDQVATFYYSDVDGGLTHLALGQVHSVVANGKRKQLPAGQFVLNFTKVDGQTFAQVGVATGEVIDRPATDFWPNWTNQSSVVFDVRWITQLVQTDNIENGRLITNVEVANIINSVLSN